MNDFGLRFWNLVRKRSYSVWTMYN